MEEKVDEFIKRLEAVEAGGDVAEMASLFTEGCELSNVALPEPLHGIDGATQFWTNYQKSLGEVRSVFRNKIVAGGRAALEWETKGGDLDYKGTSILEYEGDKISRFSAYFDPAKLGTQLAERQHG